MEQKAFLFDGNRCTGCQTCVFACRDYNDLGLGFSFRKVCEYVAGTTGREDDGTHCSACFAYSVSFACNHCERPACAEVCPTGAMHREEPHGLLKVDRRRCIGCGYCHLACPYGAPKVDRDKGCSVKCEGCSDRLQQGRLPVCVQACPARALEFGCAKDFEHRAARADMAPFPPSSETVPNLFVIAGPQAQRADEGTGLVENSAIWR